MYSHREKTAACLFQKVVITPGFLVQLAILWLFDFEGTLPLMLAAALLHELGHLVTLKAVGGRLRRISLTAFGACMEAAADPPLNCLREAAVLLAGPGVNLLLAAVGAAVLRSGGNGALFLGCNLIVGLFNMLPASLFDGGQALFLLLLRFCSPVTADRCIRACTMSVAAGFLAGGAALFLCSGYNLTVLLCGILLVTALVREAAGP